MLAGSNGPTEVLVTLGTPTWPKLYGAGLDCVTEVLGVFLKTLKPE